MKKMKKVEVVKYASGSAKSRLIYFIGEVPSLDSRLGEASLLYCECVFRWVIIHVKLLGATVRQLASTGTADLVVW